MTAGPAGVYPQRKESKTMKTTVLSEPGMPTRGLLHLGGVPFETAMRQEQGRWTEVVRDSHTAGMVIDPAGQTIMNTLVLTKAWGNPYRAEQSVPLHGELPTGWRVEGSRAVHPFSAMVAGYFLWAVGMGGDKSIRPLTELVQALPMKKRSEEVIALVDGELRFTQRWSTDEKTMKSDWSPLEKLPDRNVVTRVEMLDKHGHLRRGWSGEGAPFHIGEISISADGPFFLLNDGPLRVAGAVIRVAGGEKPKATLVDWRLDGWHTLDTPLPWRREGGFWVLRLDGWHRRYWVELGR